MSVRSRFDQIDQSPGDDGALEALCGHDSWKPAEGQLAGKKTIYF
jgi:hypothetical protein